MPNLRKLHRMYSTLPRTGLRTIDCFYLNIACGVGGVNATQQALLDFSIMALSSPRHNSQFCSLEQTDEMKQVVLDSIRK